MKHAVHLAASYFMQKIVLSSAQTLLKKAKEAMKNTSINPDLDMDETDTVICTDTFEEG